MKVFTWLVIFLLLLIGPNVFADGFYAGAGVGVSNIEESELGLSYQARPIGFKIHGGYEFTEIFAIEAAYVNSGDAKDDVEGLDVEVNLSGSVLSAVFQTTDTTPNLFTKFGYYNGEQEVKMPALGESFDKDVDGITAGLGFRHEIKDNLSIRGELDWYESDLDNLWSIVVGLQYSFGK